MVVFCIVFLTARYKPISIVKSDENVDDDN